MAHFEDRKVAKPFHLTLKEYKELFPEFRARGNTVFLVTLNPLINTSGVILNAVNSKQEKAKVYLHLSLQGFMVISVGRGESATGVAGKGEDELKEGDMVFMPSIEEPIYSLKRKMIVKDVFPRVREYTIIAAYDHSVFSFVNTDPTVVVEIEQNVNVSMEQKAYDEYLSEIEKKDNHANL